MGTTALKLARVFSVDGGPFGKMKEHPIAWKCSFALNTLTSRELRASAARAAPRARFLGKSQIDDAIIFDYRRLFMGTKFALFNYATKSFGGYVDVDFFNYKRMKE